MESIQSLCQQFAQILKGKPKINDGVCSVEIDRNLHVTIQGRPSRSELHAEISFHSQSVEPPLIFARKVAEAFRVLK